MSILKWMVIALCAFLLMPAASGKPSTQVRSLPDSEVKNVYNVFDKKFRAPIGTWKKPPVKKPDYPTEDFVILDYNAAWEERGSDKTGLLGTGRLPYSYFNLLADNGIRGTKLNYTLPANPELTRKQDQEVIDRGLNVFYIDVPDKGRWMDMQQRSKADPNYRFWDFRVPARLEDLDQWKTINYLNEAFPNCRVMVLVGGELEDVQYLAYPKAENHFDLVRKGYIGQHQEWVQSLKTNLKHPEKVLTFEQSLGAAYPIAYLLKAYDMAQTKTWGRQNVEIDIANNRGASRAYGRPMMVADDPWVGNVWHTRSPDEMEQVFYLAYFSGADYLYHEYNYLIQRGEDFLPNRWGEKYLNFGRFTALHPKRGRQIVKLAVMRGFGDTWSQIYCELTPGGWGDPKNRRVNDDSVRDYQLLDVFFPDFGTYYQTDVHHFCTGTPYGPVDMIPWDTPLEKLKDYDLVLYFGLNAMDEANYQTLKEYVRQGGKLVVALGQLRMEGNDPREILPNALNDDFLGVKLEKLPKLVDGEKRITFRRHRGRVNGLYEAAFLHGDVAAKTEDGRPVVIRNRFGKGQVYLYLTDFISKLDNDSNREFLERLAGRDKLLTIQPPSDWLDYTVWQKGRIYSIPVFNHGRMAFPSGKGADYGPWEGSITLNFDRFPFLRGKRLEAYVVDFTDSGFKFTPLALTQNTTGATVRLRVDKRTEVIIGPKGSTKSGFFARAGSQGGSRF